VKAKLGSLRSPKLRRAEELHLPPEMNGVLARLGPDDAARFNREIVAAISAAEEASDLRPIRDVIEAWYRTVLVTSDRGYQGNMAAAIKARPRRGESPDDLRRRYGL
jgi:hypothetical protein